MCQNQQLSHIMQLEGVSNVFCKGNVFSRNKAIAAFQKGRDARVIMFSLDKAGQWSKPSSADSLQLLVPILWKPLTSCSWILVPVQEMKQWPLNPRLLREHIV